MHRPYVCHFLYGGAEQEAWFRVCCPFYEFHARVAIGPPHYDGVRLYVLLTNIRYYNVQISTPNLVRKHYIAIGLCLLTKLGNGELTVVFGPDCGTNRTPETFDKGGPRVGYPSPNGRVGRKSGA